MAPRAPVGTRPGARLIAFYLSESSRSIGGSVRQCDAGGAEGVPAFRTAECRGGPMSDKRDYVNFCGAPRPAHRPQRSRALASPLGRRRTRGDSLSIGRFTLPRNGKRLSEGATACSNQLTRVPGGRRASGILPAPIGPSARRCNRRCCGPATRPDGRPGAPLAASGVARSCTPRRGR